MGSTPDLPLLGIRVVDAVRGPLAPITRYLAELGARVDHVGAGEEQADEAALAANFGNTTGVWQRLHQLGGVGAQQTRRRS